MIHVKTTCPPPVHSDEEMADMIFVRRMRERNEIDEFSPEMLDPEMKVFDLSETEE